MKKQIFYSIAYLMPLLLLLSLSFIPCSHAAVSDLYDFNISTLLVNASGQEIVEPKILQAIYQFIDENNNSLYDYLIIEPQGSIRVYDAFDELLIATESNKIDLNQFYSKKAEGPYRITIDFNGSIHEITTNNETYFDFEKPMLPDLSVELAYNSIIVKNNGADAFNFFISVYEKESRILHQKIDYLKSGEEYDLNYSSTQDTKAIIDFENIVEESDEENNFAETISSASASKDESISKSTSSFAVFKNALKIDESKPVDSVGLVADELKDIAQEDSSASIQAESKKSNFLTGNVGLNIDTPPNKLTSFLVIAASTFLLLYTYDFLFKKRRF